MLYAAHYTSPLGPMLLAGDGESLTGLWIEGQKYYAATATGALVEKPELPVFAAVKEWLGAYFAGENPPVSGLPLAPAGSDFRRIVWNLLCEIPYGTCVTYGDIAANVAKRLNRKSMSGQAVGGAVGHNPISVIIPCHRVVGANGSLTGYAGGIDKKIRLLELEGIDMSRYFVPARGTAL